jgi:hypothetical protein
LHVSSPLQAFPSEQDAPAPSDTWLTPVAGLHESTVHGFPSSTDGGVPARHAPAALHVSLPLQALPSEHDVPAARTGFEQTPVLVLHVPTAWQASLAAHETGLAPVHVPDWHVSDWVQAFPSLHALPSGFVGFEHVPVDGSHEPAT